MVKTFEDFDSKYERIHKELQENSRLVREIYGLASEEGLEGSKEEQRYFPCGSFEHRKKIIHFSGWSFDPGKETIHIGLDLDSFHNHIAFPHILANMRLIYEVSNGKADLSKVYAQLGDNIDDKIGIVSEDVSYGGRNKVQGHSFLKEPDKYLLEIFIFKGNEDELARSRFLVRDNKGNKVRYPIIDLDHLRRKNLKPKWRKKYNEYRKQYRSDDRFRIYEET